MKIHATNAINTRPFPPRNTFTLSPLLLFGFAFDTVPVDKVEEEDDEVDLVAGAELVEVVAEAMVAALFLAKTVIVQDDELLDRHQCRKTLVLQIRLR
ncbi:hypothetical protein V6N12_047657 [Hibiscus sabdariffa]|uniref:Uncharacterized protein n=1 Tax=Hibiscus sabdariffa TaxID=183260 RepID=A0ABR2CTL3_9ROSI